MREVMARNPDHPGANHLYIHAVEAGPNPELGLPSADRLLHFAPQAGHLVHMPSHIYMRVGQYRNASRANELAIAADRSYIQSCRFEQAVAAEDALPYMQPAFWSLPSRQSYGGALLQTDEPARAEQVFRDDLSRFPRNGWALFGLEQALRAQGRTQAAESVHRELIKAWKHADVQLDVAWL